MHDELGSLLPKEREPAQTIFSGSMRGENQDESQKKHINGLLFRGCPAMPFHAPECLPIVFWIVAKNVVENLERQPSWKLVFFHSKAISKCLSIKLKQCLQHNTFLMRRAKCNENASLFLEGNIHVMIINRVDLNPPMKNLTQKAPVLFGITYSLNLLWFFIYIYLFL